MVFFTIISEGQSATGTGLLIILENIVGFLNILQLLIDKIFVIFPIYNPHLHNQPVLLSLPSSHSNLYPTSV